VKVNLVIVNLVLAQLATKTYGMKMQDFRF